MSGPKRVYCPECDAWNSIGEYPDEATWFAEHMATAHKTVEIELQPVEIELHTWGDLKRVVSEYADVIPDDMRVLGIYDSGLGKAWAVEIVIPDKRDSDPTVQIYC